MMASDETPSSAEAGPMDRAANAQAAAKAATPERDRGMFEVLRTDQKKGISKRWWAVMKENLILGRLNSICLPEVFIAHNRLCLDLYCTTTIFYLKNQLLAECNAKVAPRRRLAAPLPLGYHPRPDPPAGALHEFQSETEPAQGAVAARPC
jgi:hypothetical protein